jgi:hypothetical protein
VERFLAAKKIDPAADTSAIDREIDKRVYRLCGLTKDEIKLVEESFAR